MLSRVPRFPPLLNEVEILAYDSAGSPLESFRVDVPNLTQDAFVVRERIPDLEEGWLEIRPSLKDLMGFTLTGDAALTGMDGSRLSPPQGSRLFFPEIRNGEGEMTTLFVVNPRPSPLDMTFYWHPSGLEKAVIAVVTVPASGSLKTTLEELGESGSSGYLSAEAARFFFRHGAFRNSGFVGWPAGTGRRVIRLGPVRRSTGRWTAGRYGPQPHQHGAGRSGRQPDRDE